MLAQPLSGWLERRGIHYSWVIVLLTFLTGFTAAAALGLPSALITPVSKEFGWNVEQISSVLALRFALFGLIGPFSAILMERFGMRNVVVTALAMASGGMLLSTQMTEYWQLVALWGVMLGVAAGMTALVLTALVSVRWFETHRGLVVGVLTASGATGQLVFLPVGAWMVEHYGWRMALVPLVIACVVVALAVFMFMRNRPQELGLQPLGATAPVPVPPPMKVGFTTPFKILREAGSQSVFWILAATFVICGATTVGLVQTHFILMCGDQGLGAVPAASVLALMGVFDMVGTIGSGWLSDRYDSRKLLFWYYGLRGLALFWLPYSGFTLYGLSMFALFYGLDWVATVPPTVRLTAMHFGREKVGMVFGWIFAFHQVGAAIGAFGAGRVRTLMLTYSPALFTAGAVCVLAALLAIAVRRQKVTAVQPQSATVA